MITLLIIALGFLFLAGLSLWYDQKSAKIYDYTKKINDLRKKGK